MKNIEAPPEGAPRTGQGTAHSVLLLPRRAYGASRARDSGHGRPAVHRATGIEKRKMHALPHNVLRLLNPVGWHISFAAPATIPSMPTTATN